MRLKRLELKGFKSFANETIIHFSENVTGIVGPNGSGKSNIVDAIRWVLGEQSSKDLRLEAMSDVIFNGTKKRRKSPYARVSVVFDNDRGLLPSEYSEVEIKRTLDQSGTSEYYINGTKCRLKDINTLLMDTGIGSNTYAIIALGMVDDILNDTDNARRKMFEQAAGISKYKKRKHQSKLKLKSTAADLERVEDLLHEIAVNLKSLKRQASRARRYLKVKQDYKDHAIRLAVAKSQDINKQYKYFQGKIKVEKEAIQEVQNDINKLELELEERKNKHVSKEVELSTAQKALTEIVNAIRTAENDKNITEQRVAFAERQLKEIDNREQRLHERYENAAERKEKLAELIREAEKGHTVLEQKKNELEQEKIAIEERLRIVGADRSEQLVLQQNIERSQLQYEKEISVLESRLADLKSRDTENEVKLNNLQELVDSIEESHKSEVLLIDELEKRLEVYGKNEEERQANLERVEREIEERKEELNKVNRSLDASRNEYKLIKNLIDKLEGFPESIKFLNKQEKWGSNAMLFSDILYCEEQYRSAIENYLEPYLSYYVVPTATKAFEAIALLKGAQKGKAQFFINAVFDSPDEETEDIAGLIKAIDIVEVDKQFYPLMARLLYDVYILQEIDKIDEYAAQFPSKIILAQDGTVIKAVDHISGGSSGLFEGKRIGRRKNLEKLEVRISKLQRKQADINQRLGRLTKQRQELLSENRKSEIEDLRKTLDIEYRKSQQSAIRLENTKEQIAELKSAQLHSGGQKKELKEQLAEAKEALDEVQQRLHSMKSDIEDIEGAFSDINKKAAAQSELFNEQKIKLIRQESLLERYKQDVHNNKTQVESIERTLSELKKDREQHKRERAENKEHIRNFLKIIEEKTDLKKEQESRLNDVEAIFFEERDVLKKIETEIRNKQKALQQHQHLQSEYTEKFTEVKISLSNLAERLRVEFEVSINAVINQEQEEEVNIEELEAKVERLRRKKQKFGEVNPMAVEAYEEMKERHDMIEQQKEDIIEARISLENTIKEIEERATARFMGAFGQVRENFIQVFRTLFRSEDTCDLVLADEKDPLETDLYIIARPKGKKPKSLSQLSGGEKTLTAIALLFALYLLKPAPFCIFDEVDAPLDDVNIDKFNNIIQEFSAQSQFIIVTHNKMTMASVDIIYGVYMDDPGVSGVSAVDFRHFEESGLMMSES